MRGTGILVVLAAAALALACSRQGAPAVPRVELPADARLLPTRVRRLTNLELERSVRAVTGVEAELSRELPPDIRQEGYTPNAGQDVSAAWATRYAALVSAISARAAERAGVASCSDFGSQACRAEVVATLGRRALRRPLSADERLDYERLLVENGSGPAALSALLHALLQAPSFLYLSELGRGSAGLGRVVLDDYELASQLAYTLRGGPPDEQLLVAAEAGHLRAAAGRVHEARRLLGQSDTRLQFRRFVLEWLEVDYLLQTAKSSKLFPSYDALKPFMLAETESYVDEVMVHGGASVASLLGSGFASVGPEMARFYGLSSYGPRASLSGTGRVGVLQQASFLASHAHEDVTSPVKRGDFVMRKLLCEKLKRPAELGIEVVMPPPDPRLSNRERLSQHVADPGCASCHLTLDAIGFTFEGFDAMGGKQERDHGKPVDQRADVRLGQAARATVAVRSSAELTQALLKTPVISECFARHAFRYFSAQADPAVEASFLAVREQLASAQRDSLLEVLIAYVASDLFAYREVTAP
jgi:hypothetical protein